jgi:hypothetical protein
MDIQRIFVILYTYGDVRYCQINDKIFSCESRAEVTSKRILSAAKDDINEYDPEGIDEDKENEVKDLMKEFGCGTYII